MLPHLKGAWAALPLIEKDTALSMESTIHKGGANSDEADVFIDANVLTGKVIYDLHYTQGPWVCSLLQCRCR